MRLKDHTVNVDGLHPRVYSAFFPADQVCRKILGYEMVITSARDGKHRNHSDHYKGCAWDLRTWTTIDSGVQIDRVKRNLLAEFLEETLGYAFYVHIEDDHLHIGYSPKTKAID